MLFLSHSYSRVIFLQSSRCGEFDFHLALKDLVLPRPGDPNADYRGHGWWRGRAAYCLLNGVCGRSWVTGPPWAGSLISPCLPGALRGPWSSHAASVVDASPSSGFSGLTSAEQRPLGLPEARAQTSTACVPTCPAWTPPRATWPPLCGAPRSPSQEGGRVRPDPPPRHEQRPPDPGQVSPHRCPQGRDGRHLTQGGRQAGLA